MNSLTAGTELIPGKQSSARLGHGGGIGLFFRRCESNSRRRAKRSKLIFNPVGIFSVWGGAHNSSGADSLIPHYYQCEIRLWAVWYKDDGIKLNKSDWLDKLPPDWRGYRGFTVTSCWQSLPSTNRCETAEERTALHMKPKCCTWVYTARWFIPNHLVFNSWEGHYVEKGQQGMWMCSMFAWQAPLKLFPHREVKEEEECIPITKKHKKRITPLPRQLFL